MKYTSTLVLAALFANNAEAIRQNQLIDLTTKQKGIFDLVVDKINQKEEAAKELENTHMLNEIQAEEEAKRISMTTKLADHTNQIEKFAKSVAAKVQIKNKSESKKSKKKVEVKPEPEEDRDDFEGFGSITGMAQNKERLVERTLDDPKFQAQVALEQREKERQEAEEKAEKEAAEKQQREQEAAEKKARLQNAKNKLKEALNKSIKKKKIPISERIAAKVTQEDKDKPKFASLTKIFERRAELEKEKQNPRKQLEPEAPTPVEVHVAAPAIAPPPVKAKAPVVVPIAAPVQTDTVQSLASADGLTPMQRAVQSVLNPGLLGKKPTVAQVQSLATAVPVAATPFITPVAAEFALPQSQSIAQEKNTETISSDLYKNTIEDILGKSKEKELAENRKKLESIPQTEPVQEQSENANGEEPRGFIHQHLAKVQTSTKDLIDRQTVDLIKSKTKNEIPFSQSAPKGKGILARIQEKEDQEAQQQMNKQKDELMAEAFADPSFKQQLKSMEE